MIILRIVETSSYVPGWVEIGGILCVVLLIMGTLASLPNEPEKKEKGMALVELTVVLIVIGILFALGTSMIEALVKGVKY